MAKGKQHVIRNYEIDPVISNVGKGFLYFIPEHGGNDHEVELVRVIGDIVREDNLDALLRSSLERVDKKNYAHIIA